MEGRTVSHYRILERVGGGGMGVVYKAVDTRLDRPVALKFLPPELTQDEDARLRLIREAKAASALDHPNICTVYDVDTTPEGQSFIAMSFYDGETLKKHIARGPLPIIDALDIAAQVAHGLAKAHAAGIIHRDIKPANLMITRDGVVKIVDFGIAKVVGQAGSTRTGTTQTGTTAGTVSYMSPEQINGEDIDARTDLWSLGVTLYEMLSGRLPFEGDNVMVVMKAIDSRDPVPLRELRADVPDEAARIVTRAMRKPRLDRHASAGDVAQQLIAVRNSLTSPVPRPSPIARRRWITAAIVVGVAVAFGIGWSISRGAVIRAARERIPEITRLVEQDEYTEAFRIAEEIEPHLADDPTLRGLWPRFSRTLAVTSQPQGARVSTRNYADKTDSWRDLGVTPVAGLRIPLGLQRFRFAREGKPTVEVARRIGSPQLTELNVALDDRDDGEVAVRGGDLTGWITGIEPIERIQVRDFRIGRHEVTNREFKAFIQSGGYKSRAHWDQPFSDGKTEMTWEQAIERFVDATGRPGPSTWELGDYPAGRDDFPVGGVSWYEAAAYAKSVGKSLPTVRHWIRAAGTDSSAAIAPLSNLQGSGPAAVGTFAGMSPFGAYDMAGNVREWCWNAWGSSRYILGAAWSDPAYMFTYANVQSPFDRSPTNGIRLASYPDGMPEDAAKPVELLVRDYSKEKPVAPEVFDIYRKRFAYDPAPLDAKVDSGPGTADYRLERVSFDPAYGSSRMMAYVYVPTSGTAPFQPVISFPGSTAINTSAPNTDLTAFVVKSGRMLIIPAYRGSFERRDGLTSTWPDSSRRYSEYAVNWVQDFERTLEYLETRSDVNLDKLSYLGVSWGGRWGAILPAIEPRIKAVVLIAAGLASGRAQPEVDQINYVTRVRQPVLMLNGRFDAIEPVETAQRPMFELLGTPKDQKRWVVFEDDHSLPNHRNEVAREALAWLDRHLGPVQ